MTTLIKSSLIVGFCWLFTSTCMAQATLSPRDRVLNEYPAALDRLEKYFTQLHAKGTAEEVQVDQDKSELKVVFHYQFDIDGTSRRRVRTREFDTKTNRSYEFVTSVSPRYSFRLLRKEKGDAFRVTALGSGGDAEVLDDMYYDFNQYPLAPYCVFGTPIAKFMAEPSFVLGKVSEVVQGDHKYLKLEYRTHPKKEYPAVPGWLVVSPDQGWVLVEDVAFLGLHENIRRESHIEYGKTVDGIPLPRVVSYDHPYYHRRMVFDRFEHGPVPEREFTLSAFGLPELDKPESSDHKGNPALWFFLISVAFLSVAAAFKYKSFRGATA